MWVLISADESYARICKCFQMCTFSCCFVLSFFHQEDDLALKSPRIIVNKELDGAVLLKTLSKSDRKFSNSALS